MAWKGVGSDQEKNARLLLANEANAFSVARMVELFQSIERRGEDGRCPVCNATTQVGHERRCWIDWIITEGRRRVEGEVEVSPRRSGTMVPNQAFVEARDRFENSKNSDAEEARPVEERQTRVVAREWGPEEAPGENLDPGSASLP